MLSRADAAMLSGGRISFDSLGQFPQPFRGVRVRRSVCLMAFLCLFAMSAAQAQRANVREGFWWGFGFGAAQGRLVCDICDDQSHLDLSGTVRLGATLSPHWLLGGEAVGWTNRGGGIISRRALSATVVALYYPWPRDAFYIKGGAGVAVYRATDTADAITATRPALELGAGYEWRIGPMFSLNPYLNYVRGIPGELRFDGEPIADDAGVSYLQFGIGLVLH